MEYKGWYKQGLDAILDAANFFKEENSEISEKMLKFLQDNEELTTFTIKELEGTAFYVALLKREGDYHLLGSEDEKALDALVDYFNKKEDSY